MSINVIYTQKQKCIKSASKVHQKCIKSASKQHQKCITNFCKEKKAVKNIVFLQ